MSQKLQIKTTTRYHYTPKIQTLTTSNHSGHGVKIMWSTENDQNDWEQERAEVESAPRDSGAVPPYLPCAAGFTLGASDPAFR